MALYPGATKKLIAPGANDPAIKVVGVVLHVDAGNAASLYRYFNGPSDGIESHFHIPKVGKPEQYRDTGREADANLKANSFVVKGVRYGFISVETQGLEKGEWNAHQLAEIKDLLLWASETHDFPLRKTPGPFEPGVGYHVLFGAPGPWTPVAKSCPGPDRVKQFNSILVPWMETATNTPEPPQKEGDMALSDEDVKKIAQAVWEIDNVPHNKVGADVGSKTPTDPTNPTWRPKSVLEQIENRQRALDAKLDAILAKLAK